VEDTHGRVEMNGGNYFCQLSENERLCSFHFLLSFHWNKETRTEVKIKKIFSKLSENQSPLSHFNWIKLAYRVRCACRTNEIDAHLALIWIEDVQCKHFHNVRRAMCKFWTNIANSFTWQWFLESEKSWKNCFSCDVGRQI
jgi:hypothetical protein